MLFAVLALIATAAQAQSYLPAGFTTWFSGTACPTGWSQIANSEGRLIVSVTNGSQGGLTLHDALADREDRAHIHNFTAYVTLNEKDVAADGCCDNQGAQNGKYTTQAGTAGGISGLPFSQILLCSINQNVTGSIPYGSVAYFAPSVTECPPNWSTFNQAQGRFIVPGYDDTSPIASTSPPLNNLEDRPHSHTFASSIDTNPVEYVGIAGCCNDSPSQQGLYPVNGNAINASSSLPYIQLLTCVSELQTFDADLPGEAYLFRPEAGCPVGWELVTAFSGRFLVSLPYNGQAGASFGGNSIDAEIDDPEHFHTLSGAFNIPSTGIGLASGCCAEGYAGSGNYAFDASTTDDSTNLPFLMLPLCQQIGIKH